MPSLSQVNLLGYVGNDVQLKTGKGKNYLQISIGMTKAFKPKGWKEGEKWKTKTTWVKVMFFGPYSIYASERIKKGELVWVGGELAVSEWVKDNQKRIEMYVLGKMILPMQHHARGKIDHNYGIPEEEIEDNEPAF